MKRFRKIGEAGFHFVDRNALGIAKTAIIQVDGFEKYTKETDELFEQGPSTLMFCPEAVMLDPVLFKCQPMVSPSVPMIWNVCNWFFKGIHVVPLFRDATRFAGSVFYQAIAAWAIASTFSGDTFGKRAS